MKVRPRARRPKILILGTHHMDNPGLDTYNLEADDVLAPRRISASRTPPPT